MRKGYLLISIATVFFALEYIALKYIFVRIPSVTPEMASFWGLLGAGIIASPFFLRSRHSRHKIARTIRQDGKILLLVSFLTSFGAFFWFISLARTNLGPLSLLVKSSILFSILWGFIFLKERLSFIESSGVLLAILGMILISSLKEGINLISVAYILSSSFLFSMQSFFIRKFSPNIQGKEFAYLRTLLMSFFLGLVFFFQGQVTMLPVKHLLFLSLAVSFGVLAGRAFFFDAHKFLEISKLNTFLFLEPAILLIAGVLLFNEIFSWRKITGALTIFLGLYLILKKKALPEKIKIFKS
jgi:drug/metabolite transporter (DMT)-like permease